MVAIKSTWREVAEAGTYSQSTLSKTHPRGKVKELPSPSSTPHLPWPRPEALLQV